MERFADLRPAHRSGEIGPEGALVVVQHDRLQRGARRGVAHRRGGRPAAVAERDRGRGAGDAGGPDRAERPRDVQDSAAIGGVGAGSPRVVGRAQEDVGDLHTGQPGEGLREQRGGAGDLRRGKARAGEHVGEALAIDVEAAVFVDAADPLAPCGEIVVRLVAGPVAEIGDHAVLIDRTGDDHAAVAGGVEAGGEGIDLGGAIVAGGNHHQGARGDGTLDRST